VHVRIGKPRFRVSIRPSPVVCLCDGCSLPVFATERGSRHRLGDVLQHVRRMGRVATFSSRPTSHLPGALLTFEELAGIKCSIAAADTPSRPAITKGSGVA
jgi:hypothetical protein